MGAELPAAASRAQPLYPARPRFPGRLIAVEGIDGSGKSTQIRLLMQWLQSAGHPVHLTNWNSSPVVHGALRGAKRARALVPTTFCLMHAADLADRLERDIVPRLRAGGIVLADRWVCTALARDAARGLDPEWIRGVYAFAPRPRLTVYFRVPVEVALARLIASRAELKYHEAGLDLGLAPDAPTSFRLFQQRVVDRYEALVREERLAVVDAREPVAVQQLRLRELVGRALAGYPRGRLGLAQVAAGLPGAPQ